MLLTIIHIPKITLITLAKIDVSITKNKPAIISSTPYANSKPNKLIAE